MIRRCIWAIWSYSFPHTVPHWFKKKKNSIWKCKLKKPTWGLKGWLVLQILAVNLAHSTLSSNSSNFGYFQRPCFQSKQTDIMESKLVADIMMVKIFLCLYFFLFVYFISWCGVKPIYNIILTVFTCETNEKQAKTKHLLLLPFEEKCEELQKLHQSSFWYLMKPLSLWLFVRAVFDGLRLENNG